MQFVSTLKINRSPPIATPFKVNKNVRKIRVDRTPNLNMIGSKADWSFLRGLPKVLAIPE